MLILDSNIISDYFRGDPQVVQPLQILPFDSECTAHVARIRVALAAAGTPIGAHDTLIAATALRNQATLVPRQVIDEAVQRIRDGSITNVVYDPQTARLTTQ